MKHYRQSCSLSTPSSLFAVVCMWSAVLHARQLIQISERWVEAMLATRPRYGEIASLYQCEGEGFPTGSGSIAEVAFYSYVMHKMPMLYGIK